MLNGELRPFAKKETKKNLQLNIAGMYLSAIILDTCCHMCLAVKESA